MHFIARLCSALLAFAFRWNSAASSLVIAEAALFANEEN